MSSGGAKGWSDESLCPGCKPLYPGYAPAGKPPSFHSVAAPVFRVSQHNLLHTKRGQLFGAQGTRRQESESKFSPLPGLPFARGGYPVPHRHPLPSTAFARARDSSTPVLGPRPSCPLRSHGAPHVLQQEQTLGAATGICMSSE